MGLPPNLRLITNVGPPGSLQKFPPLSHGKKGVLRIILPLPPTMNNYRACVLLGGKPRLITSKAGRDYHQAVKSAVYDQLPTQAPLSGRLCVWILCSMARNGKSDLDNRVKPALDALTAAGVWRDDSQIDILHVMRGPVEAPGRLDVRIEET